MKRTLLFLLFPLIAHAQIYKWVDEKGRVQYGEKPPAGAKATPLRQEASPASKPAPAQDLSQREADFRRRQIERQRAEEAHAHQATQRQGQCENARNRLAAAENAGRHFSYKGGEKVYATDAERAATLARMREQVSQVCR
ncbi:MAG: DUF4124 domain-containing protein [Betaproteobacteria bacterium]